MILTFYDRNFTALSDNASLNVGEWSLTRRAVDYDDFTAKSEAFEEDVNPTFVIMQDDRGRYVYGAFAGVPELTDENQTSLQASDLKTIFNNDCLIKIDSVTADSYVLSTLAAVLATFSKQCVQGTITGLDEIADNLYFEDLGGSLDVRYDLSDLYDNVSETFYTFEDLVSGASYFPSTEQGVVNFWDDVLAPLFKYYGLFMVSELDLASKKVIFKIERSNKNQKFVNLYETSEKNFGKWVASTNEAQYFIQDVDEDDNFGTLHEGEKFILNSKNEIGVEGKVERDLYPIKKKIVYTEVTTGDDYATDFAEAVSESVSECLEELIDSMYNENLELNVTDDLPDNFDSVYTLYIKKGVEYKTLPLGEIYEDSRGNKKITIGYKNNDVVFYI